MEIKWPKKGSSGSWTASHAQWGTGNVSYLDSISPEFFEEKQAIFKRAWLNVGRGEQLPKMGSYFTKQMPGRMDMEIDLVLVVPSYHQLNESKLTEELRNYAIRPAL